MKMRKGRSSQSRGKAQEDIPSSSSWPRRNRWVLEAFIILLAFCSSPSCRSHRAPPMTDGGMLAPAFDVSCRVRLPPICWVRIIWAAMC